MWDIHRGTTKSKAMGIKYELTYAISRWIRSILVQRQYGGAVIRIAMQNASLCGFQL